MLSETCKAIFIFLYIKLPALDGITIYLKIISSATDRDVFYYEVLPTAQNHFCIAFPVATSLLCCRQRTAHQ
jgi:hypothetical protein